MGWVRVAVALLAVHVGWASGSAGSGVGGWSFGKTAGEEKLLSAAEEKALDAKQRQVRAAVKDAEPTTVEGRRAAIAAKRQKLRDESMAMLKPDHEKNVRAYADEFQKSAQVRDQKSQKKAVFFKAAAEKEMLNAAKKKRVDAEEELYQARRRKRGLSEKKSTGLLGALPFFGATKKAAPQPEAVAPAVAAVEASSSKLVTLKTGGVVAVAAVVATAVVTGVVQGFKAPPKPTNAEPNVFSKADVEEEDDEEEDEDEDETTTFARLDEEDATVLSSSEAAAVDALIDETEAVEPAGGKAESMDESAAAAAEGADETPPGMTAEAAERLETMNKREEILGRLEGRYKLIGKEMPFGVRNKSLPELKELLKELRAESNPPI